MAEYDLLVLGGGTGNLVAAAAADEGLETALVEAGPLGGTCLNRGCNPSKKLVHRANVAETVRRAESLGVDATVDDVAYRDVVEEVNATVDEEAERKAEAARERDRVTLYATEGRFVDERTVEVDAAKGPGTERVTADRVVLAGGTRPRMPDAIDGLDEADVLTSADALELAERPDRLVVVGGGYVAVELGHFFDAMGADVAVVGRSDVLLAGEDRAVAERVTDAYRDRLDLHLDAEVTAVESDDAGGTDVEADGRETTVVAEADDGETVRVEGDEVLVATGRVPNTDRWNVEAAGIETDEDGYVETDEYLRTSVDGVWAVGDVVGDHPFKHAGDKEAEYVVENAVRGEEVAVEYPGMAHAVFGAPEVGSFGRTEGDLDDETEYEVGRFAYDETALGSELPHDGFAKVLVGDEGAVLGFHVVGPEASVLLHEVSTAVAAGADAETIAEAIHVHPALSEVVQGAFRDVGGVAPTGF